jgi:hypothetical protein
LIFKNKFFPGLAATLFASPDAVVHGSSMDLICQSEDQKPISECRYEVPGFSEIKIFDGVSQNKYKFIGKGLAKGECGLRLHSAMGNNTGQVKCRLIFEDTSEQVAETSLTVLHPIEQLKIVTNSMNSFNNYIENEPMEIKCTAEGGNPPPTLTISKGV